LIHSGWSNCTICRRSATRDQRRVVAPPDDDSDVQPNDESDDGDNVGVFIQPDDSAAAAAIPVPNTSDDYFLPRSHVVKNLIQHHRAEIEKFDNAIDQLLD
jgi:hypothetical protein